MMTKKNLCIGPSYGHSSWKKYWEGELLRTNENIGTISTSMVNIMGNYGITDNLNIIFGLPWVKTSASAGTLHGMQGIQDLSLLAKYRFYNKEFKKFRLSAMGQVGVSTPLTNYSPDFLPLSIGMHSKNLMGRLIADVQHKTWFATGSFQYMVRSNVQLDRSSYYTTRLYLTDLVQMPDMWNLNFRAGYRKGEMYLEAVADKWNTVGGFDIRRNDMPFVSNNMDAFRVGVNAKIPIPKVNGLTVVANAMQTLSGRNMGKSLMYTAGFFYILDFSKKKA
ncbi:MAG: hypothetical protein KG003_05810 [Bacteroidetes bacterium]|nr:hypothetical protein [Bacteroidota bacterium]